MAAEQELTSANPAAVAKLTGIHELEREWLSGYAEGAIALREEVEAGAVAQANFIEISYFNKIMYENRTKTHWNPCMSKYILFLIL